MQVAAENLDKVPNTAGLQKGQPAFLSVDGPREKLRRMAGRPLLEYKSFLWTDY